MILTDRTYDIPLIQAVMTSPDIWATVAEDGQRQRDFTPNVHDDCWLLMTHMHDVVALYHIQRRNSILFEIHAQVMPDHRQEHSRETGIAALRWIYDNIPHCEKVIAWIPTKYPNVRDFTLSMGFQIEGVNCQSYIKCGVMYDQWLLGITRSDIEGLLNE